MEGGAQASDGRQGGRASAAAERHERSAAERSARGEAQGEAWKWVRIPAALHEEYKAMAGQEQRSIAGQIIWVLQDALRREREQKRRHTDQVPGATKRRARGAA